MVVLGKTARVAAGMTMSLNIQESQRNAVVRMLSLREGHPEATGAPLWKVLIYDKACQNLLAPLMKVEGDVVVAQQFVWDTPRSEVCVSMA